MPVVTGEDAEAPLPAVPVFGGVVGAGVSMKLIVEVTSRVEVPNTVLIVTAVVK